MARIIRGMTEAIRPAGFWIRLIAVLVDALVITFVQASFNVVASIVYGLDRNEAWGVTPISSFFTLVFSAAYMTLLHASTGQTIGKLVVGVRVVALDGTPPELGAAFLRWLGYFASWATLGLGYVMAGLRTDKRALHDLIAGTRVEHVRGERRGDAPGSRQDEAERRDDATAPPGGVTPLPPVLAARA
jgi:uncharacterized RDD family membrane protein YckC